MTCGNLTPDDGADKEQTMASDAGRYQMDPEVKAEIEALVQEWLRTHPD